MFTKAVMGRGFVFMLFLSLAFTYSLHTSVSQYNAQKTLTPGNWFNNDTRIEEILRANVPTNYTFLEISKPHFIASFEGGIDPFFAQYDVWYRHFNFYPFDPETTPSGENFRIDGVFFIDGRIKIYGHVTADTLYI